MRHWIVCFLALIVSGCWMSDSPNIPLNELVQPAGLPGRYWTISLEDAGVEPGLIEFRRGADGAMIGDDAGQSVGGRFRLVHTSLPGVYLEITDYDGGSVIYGFLEHRDFGAWQDYGIEAVGQDAFTGPNLAWMQEIADRYGLSINASDPDETRIEGEIHGLAIPSLFADPAFLATLRVKPVQLYLPTPPAPEERDELFPQGMPSLQLQLDQANLPGAEWVAPMGFEGEYSQSYEYFLGSSVQRFVRMPDGRFEVLAIDPQGSEARPQVLGLLPLEGLDNEYLAVSFGHWKYEDEELDYLSLSIIQRTEQGWSSSAILVRGTETLVGRQDLLSQPMTEAARRHGASLDGYKLRGNLTAQSLLALLQDGQFTTGLALQKEGARKFRANKRF